MVPLRDYASYLSASAKFIDAVAILVGGWLAFSLAVRPSTLWGMPDRYLLVTFLAVGLMFSISNANGVYDSWRGRGTFRLLWLITVSWAGTLIVLGVMLFFTDRLPRYRDEWFLDWAVITLAIIVATRLLTFGLLSLARARGLNRKKVAIVGTGRIGREVAAHLRKHSWMGFEIVAFFDDDPELEGTEINGIKVRGEPGQLAQFAAQREVSEVWLNLPLKAENRIKAILADLRHSTVNIRLVPDFLSYQLLNHSITTIAGRPMIDLSSTPMHGFNRLVKATEDYVLATLILVLVSPLMAIIALAVKLSSPGPVLFRQKRHGWDGWPIEVYKFRSMKVHAEPDGQVTQATERDPRLTRIGQLLRRTSLDELPQFINVLEGKMSIVGPRPHAIEHGEYYKDIIDGYMKRHKVKPGITGWAQIKGHRGETDTVKKMERRVEHDLYYINNWSLALDLQIILLTVVRGFMGKNAY